MPTVAALLAHPPLGLRPLVVHDVRDDDHRAGSRSDDDGGAVTWAHSTDLLDPTPFLDPGALVLTTGAQLPVGPDGGDLAAEAITRSYVERLADAGVLALGFGRDVVHADVPAALVQACRRRGLTLFEVPYSTPFVAVASWVADERARAGHARADWAVRTMRAVAAAAHRDEGLGAVLSTCARATTTGIALVEPHRVRAWDADGTAVPASRLREAPWTAVEQEARRLLAQERRAATSASVDGTHASYQTLGRPARLSGVLVRLAPHPADAAEAGVLASAAALAGLSLEQDARASQVRQEIRGAILSLVLAGHAAAVRSAARRLGTPLPREPLRIVQVHGDDAALDAVALRLRRTDSFAAPVERGWAALAPAAGIAEWAPVLDGTTARAGASEETTYEGAARAWREARIAAADAVEGELRLFGDLAGRPLEWITLNEGAARVAGALLDRLRTEGEADLLPALRTWLEHGCQWDPAAKSLGVHRHTLRRTIERCGRLLGRDLSTMDARAEVWWAIRATG